MNNYSIEIVGPKRTVRASCVPTRVKHEVVDDQLASSVKQFRQSLFPIRSLENILFVNGLPRQVPSLLAELEAETVVLASSDKINAASQYVIGEVTLAQTIIVERATELALTKPLEDAGLTIVRA